MDALPDRARTLQARIRNDIPLARVMDIGIVSWNGASLVATAPLAPNINDKGCAFGGSLASVMTVAGWALVVLALDVHAMPSDVYVARSEVVYRAPVWSDFHACATLAEGADWDRFMDTLARRGKARIALACHVTEAGNGKVCATLAAEFVALRAATAGAAHARDAAQ